MYIYVFTKINHTYIYTHLFISRAVGCCHRQHKRRMPQHRDRQGVWPDSRAVDSLRRQILPQRRTRNTANTETSQTMMRVRVWACRFAWVSCKTT